LFVGSRRAALNGEVGSACGKYRTSRGGSNAADADFDREDIAADGHRDRRERAMTALVRAPTPTQTEAAARRQAFHQKIADRADALKAAAVAAKTVAAKTVAAKTVAVKAAAEAPAALAAPVSRPPRPPGAQPPQPDQAGGPRPGETAVTPLLLFALFQLARDDNKVLPRANPFIADIQKAVARHFNITRHDLISQRRTAELVKPRQIAAYLSRELTQHSLPEIGRRFGNRDHTTILYAVRKISRQLAADPELAHDIALLIIDITGVAQ
jgi:hypothetical protein